MSIIGLGLLKYHDDIIGRVKLDNGAFLIPYRRYFEDENGEDDNH